jgi:hypothetical protein
MSACADVARSLRGNVEHEKAHLRPYIDGPRRSRRAYLVCRAGFAGRGTPLARATERLTLAPDPRFISGRFYPFFAFTTCRSVNAS